MNWYFLQLASRVALAMAEDIVGLGFIVRVLAVIILMIVGISGNALILAIYVPNRNQPGRLFMIILAITDLFGVPVILAQK